MTLVSPDPAPVAPVGDLPDGEAVAEATGILMVRYQLTHDQARTALAIRAERARVPPRVEAERIIASQDASVRRWATGPVTGVLDRQRFQPHT